MKIVEVRMMVILVARLSGVALHAGSLPKEARPVAPLRPVAAVLGLVVARFWIVDPRQVGVPVGPARQAGAVAPRACLPTVRPAAHLMAASQWQIAASARLGAHRCAPGPGRCSSWALGVLSARTLALGPAG